MKLLTKELEKRFAEVGRQEDNSDPLVIAKFFNPCGGGTWFATEYNEEDKIFFGYVAGLVGGVECDEWGTFSLQELEELTLPFGLTIERDLYFKEKRFSELGLG